MIIHITNRIFINGTTFYMELTDQKISGLDNNMQVGYCTNSNGDAVPVITTNKFIPEDSNDFSDSLKFSLLHECGHIKLGHTTAKKHSKLATTIRTIKTIVLGRNLSVELEADSYAASFLGKDACVSVLSKRLDNPLINKKEVQKRIDSITNSSIVTGRPPLIVKF